MIPVAAALDHVLALAAPLGTKVVALSEAGGRVLAAPARATRDQPPFSASAMDGYALCPGAVEAGARYAVVGEAGAGHGTDRALSPGEALRIFTGAPVPPGADRVVIQENVARDGDAITLSEAVRKGDNIRPQGTDFKSGFVIDAPRRLRPVDLALLAAMNVAQVTVTRRPEVALIATGDELVMPGEVPRPDQIVASNTFALKAMVEAVGGVARLLPIARDTPEALRTVIDLALGADLIVTIGGASVGDHDHVGAVVEAMGMARAFYKVAMRPGKPLMAGRLGGAALLGLPGNPVSSIVCGHVFMLPMLRRMLGLADACLPLRSGLLATALPANGPRAHYMRARVAPASGLPRIHTFDRQDSALLSVLSEADALLVRPPNDPPRDVGAEVRWMALDADD